jgi:hypothetical protein
MNLWEPPTLNQALQQLRAYCAVIAGNFSLLWNDSIMKVSMEANQDNTVTE